MLQSNRIPLLRTSPCLVGGLIAAVAFLNIISIHKSWAVDQFESVAYREGVPCPENKRRDLLDRPESHDPHRDIRMKRDELLRLRLNVTALNGTNWSNSTKGWRRFKLNLTAIDEAIEADSKRGTLQLPNILLIGAQKGGSSALAHWLFTHGVCRPTAFPGENWRSHRKEAHYFDKDDRFEQGIKFYAKRFYNCTSADYSMDATPAYLAFPDRIKRTYDEAGNNQTENLKIVVILREPIARDLSVYNHKASLFREQADRNVFWRNAVNKKSGNLLPFEEYARTAFSHMLHPEEPCAESPVSFCYGLYAMFLKRWMQLFRHRQILVLSYDELIQNEEKLMWRLRTFIGLEDGEGPAEIEEVNTKHDEHKLSLPPCQLQKKMARGYNIANKELYKLLERKKVPWMEQRPFPPFVLSNCTTGDREMTAGPVTMSADLPGVDTTLDEVHTSGQSGAASHEMSSAGSHLDKTPDVLNILDV